MAVKRRYRRAGTEGAARPWFAVAAGAGLAACLLYGLLVLVPANESQERAAPQAVSVGTTAPPADAATHVSQPILADSTATDVTPGDVHAVASSGLANPCQAAMAAALSNARIEFRSNSTEIVPASRNVISVLAALAHACPGEISIAGHSDDLGPEDRNLDISQRRASAVAQAFVEYGIEPGRLSSQGYGSTRPIADNSSVEGRARNRRIEMTLVENEALRIGEIDHVDDAD